MSSLSSTEVASLVEKHTHHGNKWLRHASSLLNEPVVAKEHYGKAIKEFVSAYKCALLLNSNRSAESVCAFNLGAAHVAGGDARRGVDVLYTVLDKVKTIDNDHEEGNTITVSVSASTKADVYYNLALGHEKMGNAEEAIKYFEHALNEYSSLSNMEPRLCDTHIKIANIRVQLKLYLQAQMNFSAASRIYLSMKDYGNGVLALVSQANAALSDVNVSNDECKRILEICCAECKNIESSDVQGKVLCEVGLLYSAIGNLHHALVCFETCIELSKLDESQTRRAVALQNAGVILNRLREFERAVGFLHKAAMLHGKLGMRNAQGQCFCTLGFALSQLSLVVGSCEAYNHALQASFDCDDKEGIWQAHEGLGVVYYLQDNLPKAEFHLKASLAAHAQSKTPNEVAQDRIIKNLMNILKIRAQNEALINPKEKEKKDSKEPQQQIFITSTEDKQSPRRKQRKKRYEYNAGRREYQNDDNQPVFHIARGLSNLTQASYDSFGHRIFLEESESTEEEPKDNLWNKLQNLIFSSSDSSEDEKKKNPKTVHHGMKQVAYKSEGMLHASLKHDPRPSSRSSSNRSPSRRNHPKATSLLDIEEKETENDTNGKQPSTSTPTTTAAIVSESPRQEVSDYVKTTYESQLKKAEQDTSDTEDFTSVISDSSTEHNETLGITSVPKTMPQSPPPVAPDAEEPVYTQTIKKSLRFANHVEPGQSTHLYESIKVAEELKKNEQETNVTQSPIYDDVPDKEAQDEIKEEITLHENDEEEEIKPLSSIFPGADNSNPSESTGNKEVGEKGRQKDDPLPSIPPRDNGKKKRPSSACIIT